MLEEKKIYLATPRRGKNKQPKRVIFFTTYFLLVGSRQPKNIVNAAQGRVATVMEKLWNFEIFWTFWKSHGIWTNIWKGHGKAWNFEIIPKSHGKIMEFDKQIQHFSKSAPLCGSFSRSPLHVCR